VEEEDACSATSDPLRMYLRKMGSVSLLTREGEVELAKRIEDGECRVLQVVLNSTVAIEEILDLGNKLRQQKIRVREVVKDADEDDVDSMRTGISSGCARCSKRCAGCTKSCRKSRERRPRRTRRARRS